MKPPEGIRALRDDVIILPDAPDETSPGGVVLVGSEKPQRGTVIAVGPEQQTIKPDDLVIFHRFAGNELLLADEFDDSEGVTLLRLEDEQVLGIVEDPEL